MAGKNERGEIVIKACCAIAAFILWLYIYNVENPALDKNISVPVSVINNQILAESKLAPVIENGITLKITVRGNVSDISGLKEGDFDLRADLSSVDINKGENKIPVIVEKKPSSIKVTNADNLFIYINVDDMVEKQVPVNIVLEGEAREGYYGLQPETEYKEATVKGAKKLVDKVQYAVIRCDIKDAYRNINLDAKFQAESAGGTVYKYVIVEPDNLDLTVQVKKTKTVPVNVQLSGILEDYGIGSIQSANDSVEIAGDDAVLQNITAINTETVVISELNGAKTINSKLIVPEGTVVVGNIPEVKLNILYSNAISRKMTVPVRTKNLSSLLSAVLDQSTATVNLSGTASELSSLSPDNVECYLDLNGFEEGNYEIQVKLRLPESVSKLSVNPEKIGVKLEKK
ncbi:MAG: YbbR-like domain-containing protein [Clostridiaceae bacterium]